VVTIHRLVEVSTRVAPQIEDQPREGGSVLLRELGQGAPELVRRPSLEAGDLGPGIAVHEESRLDRPGAHLVATDREVHLVGSAADGEDHDGPPAPLDPRQERVLAGGLDPQTVHRDDHIAGKQPRILGRRAGHRLDDVDAPLAAVDGDADAVVLARRLLAGLAVAIGIHEHRVVVEPLGQPADRVVEQGVGRALVDVAGLDEGEGLREDAEPLVGLPRRRGGQRRAGEQSCEKDAHEGRRAEGLGRRHRSSLSDPAS
jgi:hypothetical protein